MHDTAAVNFIKFVNDHVIPYFEKKEEKNPVTFIDVGSYDVNGTLKTCLIDEKLSIPWEYTGVDMCPGKNVDIVANASDLSTVVKEQYDFVVSTSCFEHDPMFWMTFLEMVKVCKPGGMIYVNAPSTGPYHAHPGDCWRFYADSWKSLADWSEKNNLKVTLVETYIDRNGMWKDSVGIFVKN